jgi:hypothetical protein
MTYIQRRGNGYVETVDEFKSYKEAMEMLREYQQADRWAHYYTSPRPCSDWKEASNVATQ